VQRWYRRKRNAGCLTPARKFAEGWCVWYKPLVLASDAATSWRFLYYTAIWVYEMWLLSQVRVAMLQRMRLRRADVRMCVHGCAVPLLLRHALVLVQRVHVRGVGGGGVIA
jgi:hypothetical protein